MFIDATFSTDGQDNLVTPDEIGRGSVSIQFQEKDEEKVVSLSNDKIRIDHRLSKQMEIHEYISEYDTMTFRYSIMVEDGITPYKLEASATLDVSGITLRWNRE